jgi:hypothetical protein
LNVDDKLSGLPASSWPAKPPSFKKDDEVIVFDKKNPSKIEGYAVVVEVSGATVRVRGFGGREIYVNPNRLKKTGTPGGAAPPPGPPGPPDHVFILPDPQEIGGPNSKSYRDKVREIVRKAHLDPNKWFIDPRPVMELIQDAGGPFVGKERMEALLTEMSEEIGITPIDVVSGVVHLKLFIASDSTIEKAASKWSDRGEEIEILSPTSLRVLSKAEMNARITAAVRENADRKSSIERESFVAFCRSVEALAGPMSATTTREVFDLLPKSDGEGDDADGKLRKKIAAALKEIGFLPQTSVVDGKKTKVFVRRRPTSLLGEEGAGKAAMEARLAHEEGPRAEMGRLDHKMQVEKDQETLAETAVVGDGDVHPVAVAVSGDGVPASPPGGSAQDEDQLLLPADWKEKIAAFLQGAGSDRTHVSLEGIILEALDRIPQEIRVMDRGRLSQYLTSIGLVNVKYDNHGDSKSERKMFHVEGNPPSEDEMREHFKDLDTRIMERLDIRVSDAPDWMTEEQRVNLSYLEHAVLLLCEDRPHNRTGLFPGHPNPDWQRKVVSSLAERGLVVSNGGGWSMTYSGVRPSIEQALDRSFLLDMFWKREVARSAQGPRSQQASENGPEEEETAEEAGPEEGTVTVAELSAMVQDMFEALKNHAEEIRKLKRRVRDLESEGDSDA